MTHALERVFHQASQLPAERQEALAMMLKQALEEDLYDDESIPARRERAISSLRGSATYIGGIVSPIDEPWDAQT